MRNANAFAAHSKTLEQNQGERRAPARSDGAGLAGAVKTANFDWPRAWPAALYRGDTGAECTVQEFSTNGARLRTLQAPPAGAQVALKFPFTVYLRGRVAWSRDDCLEVEFDEDARRSARLVEEVLLGRMSAC